MIGSTDRLSSRFANREAQNGPTVFSPVIRPKDTGGRIDEGPMREFIRSGWVDQFYRK